MTPVSRQQKLNRWDTLTDSLREALLSETHSAIVWDTCAAEHLSKEKADVVANIVSAVLFGFVHADDVAHEIRDTTGIDIKIAQSLADTFTAKIFSRYKNELASIYAMPQELAASSPQPFTLDSVSGPVGVPTAPKETASKPSAPPAVGVPAAPAAPVTFSQISAPVAPVAAEKIQASSSPAPAPSAAAPQAPLIIQSRTEVSQVKTAPEFKLNISPESFAGGTPRTEAKKSSGLVPRPAQLELGSMIEEKKNAPSVAKTEIAAPRVVHYTDMRTPLPALAAEEKPKAAPESFSGIKSSLLKTTSEFAPPSPPKPPAPTAPSTSAAPAPVRLEEIGRDGNFKNQNAK